MIYIFGLSRNGAHAARKYLAFKEDCPEGVEIYESIVPVSYEAVFEGDQHRFFDGTYVFTDISHLSGRKAEVLNFALNKVRDSPLRVRVLNDPFTFTARYQSLRSLHEEGINRHNVYWVDEHRRPASWPVFLRQEPGHWHTSLLHDPDALNTELDSMRANGIWLGDKLIVEHNDVRSPDGLYRKYSAFRMGERIFPAHLMIGSQWYQRYRTDCPEMMDSACLAEEMEYLRTNPHAAQVMAIFRRLGIEYGRMDYGILDGRVQVWEINDTPTLLRPGFFTEEFEKPRLPASLLLSRFMYEAFAALDTIR